MHRAFLRVTALFVLLAVMAVAGGCVALYTVSRAMDQPDDSGGGVGLPLFPPGAPAPSATPTAAVTTQPPGGDGLPFDPYVTDTPPSVARETDPPVETARPSSNATPPWIPMPTETPPVAGPPPHDEIRRPTLPATPL